MCGRFLTRTGLALERDFNLGDSHWLEYASLNALPSMQVPVVRMRESLREGVMMRWGLIPSWARGVPPSYSTFNATVERLDTASAWRDPWRRGQRCILPVLGFYEPHIDERGTKVTYYIRVKDRPWFGLAGLWDRSTREDGTIVESCTIVTLPASPFMAQIHNQKQRQPAMLHPRDHEAWLSGTPDEARAVLVPYEDELLEAEPMTTGARSGIDPKQGDLF